MEFLASFGKKRAFLIGLTLLIGCTLSVVMHEFIHLALHPGNWGHLQWFPSPGVIAEINVELPADYDLEGEEMAAYLATGLMLMITAMAAADVYDATDKRQIGQILLKNELKSGKITPVEAIKLLESL
ncbi:hypothetical protein KC949_03480 [Candidatus Saccharibacteria bacterium]|nr:hypothetical protein [Candidatus Saccharibacteria bacterium]